jgi:hypothetical protein
MACGCDKKEILKILRGTKGREIYITVEGLDWDFQDPPPGYIYRFDLAVHGPSGEFALTNIPIVNSNTVKFTLDAYEVDDDFYDTGLYGLALWALKMQPPNDPEIQYVLDVDHCIFVYENPECPPPC